MSIKVKVDTKSGVITLKKGLFGKSVKYSPAWYEEIPMSEIIEDFKELCLENYERGLDKSTH